MIDINSLFKTTPEIKIIIANNFKKRRKEHDFSQQQLALKSGVSLGSIKRFEQIGEISLSNLIKISQILDLQNDLINLFTTPHYKDIMDLLK
jgi:transcriptional regulator with XRE-family HTH domain